jgi:hypothetical protein
MPSLYDDTLADKLVRFAIGVVLGVGVTWYHESDAIAIVACGLLVGILAAAFGNRFIEWFVREG